MAEKEILGKYIQGKLRGKGIEDKKVAEILSLSVKTVPKIYLQSEIPCDRIAKISILLDEDVYKDYYGNTEPLKSLLNREAQKLQDRISKLERVNEKNLETINDKNVIINLQNKLITELEEKLKKSV